MYSNTLQVRKTTVSLIKIYLSQEPVNRLANYITSYYTTTTSLQIPLSYIYIYIHIAIYHCQTKEISVVLQLLVINKFLSHNDMKRGQQSIKEKRVSDIIERLDNLAIETYELTGELLELQNHTGINHGERHTDTTDTTSSRTAGVITRLAHQDKTSRTARVITRLAHQDKTQETNTLSVPLDYSREDTTGYNPPQERNKNDHNFVIGDKVIITNNYAGERGTQGIVTHTTKQRVTILDSNNRSHNRKHSNVKHD